mgnify:CR=1 FL=1
MENPKLKEITEELREVVLKRSNVFDSLLPPLLFLIINAIAGLNTAMYASLILGGLLTISRLVRRQPLIYALGGLAGAGAAYLISRFLGRAEGVFIPGIANGVLTVILCLVSVLVRRPVVAWTSFLARRWPLGWYWHERVRPAYSEVTMAWGVFFAIRTAIQYLLFVVKQIEILTLINFVAGWPAMILLLIASYLFGSWRLRNLHGPSVDEYISGTPPPWSSQQRGF